MFSRFTDTSILRRTNRTCIACANPIQGALFGAPCGHFYDKACVLRLFENATYGDAPFPPRCCGQSISFDVVWPYASAGLYQCFVLKTQDKASSKKHNSGATAHNPSSANTPENSGNKGKGKKKHRSKKKKADTAGDPSATGTAAKQQKTRTAGQDCPTIRKSAIAADPCDEPTSARLQRRQQRGPFANRGRRTIFEIRGYETPRCTYLTPYCTCIWITITVSVLRKGPRDARKHAYKITIFIIMHVTKTRRQAHLHSVTWPRIFSTQSLHRTAT